jgi:hypothetical protein
MAVPVGALNEVQLRRPGLNVPKKKAEKQPT